MTAADRAAPYMPHLEAGAHGFGPPLYPVARRYCGACTPSWTGVAGLPKSGASLDEPRDLFGRAA